MFESRAAPAPTCRLQVASPTAAMPCLSKGFTSPLSSSLTCRVEAPFPELPSDANTDVPTWRTGLHSDWRLVLGPTTYNVHKVLTGHGPRASLFLCSAFTTGQQLSAHGVSTAPWGCETKCGAFANETDLTNILPEQVWPVFGDVLDFIYTGELHLTDKNVLALLRCADALQIKMLFCKCINGINERLLAVATAPTLLVETMEVLCGHVAENITGAAQDVIVENFDSYPISELRRIPSALLIQIMQRDNLGVIHENEVFDIIYEITEGILAESTEEAPQADTCATVSKLWQTVRFGALSNSYVMKACQVETIPKMALILARAHHRTHGKSMAQSPAIGQPIADGWHSVGPLGPRKPFKDLVCAVMYSVDTDAKTDRDVERTITAATLVAEEIGFLGGRAILENIFAKSQTSDNGELYLDQVDVAFVLAPWTPSEHRIARLINFVDQGGGAVLFSFIGGLSKGQWLEGEYEPLITGKVSDNSPYEDVYLSTTPVCGSDGMKCTEDLLTPPKILCGVDSINGHRRITSSLVAGAKVLAQWSDLQPLVVQHPEKNVFSISQRSSRIFELEEDLGHDDTLQLVLNVMGQAGKRCRQIRGTRGSDFVQNF